MKKNLDRDTLPPKYEIGMRCKCIFYRYSIFRLKKVHTLAKGEKQLHTSSVVAFGK
jgi:hypothetical protein